MSTFPHSVVNSRHVDGDVQWFPFSALGASAEGAAQAITLPKRLSMLCAVTLRGTPTDPISSVRHKWVRSVLHSHVLATSDDCEVSKDVALPLSDDLAVVVTDAIVCVACHNFFGSDDKDSVVGVSWLSLELFPRSCTLLLAVSIPVYRSAASSPRLGWRASAIWVSALCRTCLWDQTH